MNSWGPVRVRRSLVAAAFVTVGVGLPSAAAAQTLYTGTPTPNVGRADVGARPAPSAAAGRILRAQAESSTSLALTGADIAELGLIGLGAVTTGTVLVRRSRRTT
jgi:hypothetical protein